MTNKSHVLAVVMPVYNEAECIGRVLESWLEELDRLAVGYRIIVLNDGSRDGTKQALEVFKENPNIIVVNKQNTGHGPTILHGYHTAVEIAEWVFQVDSDDEMSPRYFNKLWEKRKDYVALFGVRVCRQQGVIRRAISITSRFIVRILYGGGVSDVNTPYRLLRSDLLREIIQVIPSDTFAPNILISGMYAGSALPVFNFPVPHDGRKTGVVSIVKWRMMKAVIRAFWQTLVFRLKTPSSLEWMQNHVSR